jgi:O-antigen/teichoic acid export membrane protein
VCIVTRGHGSIIGLLLLVPTFTSILTLTVALVCITRFLPLREAVEPGPLLRERIEQSQRPAFLSFVVDTVVWRELLFLLLLLTTQHTLSTFGFYTFSVLLCTQLVEGVPVLFVSCWLPMMSRLLPPRQSISPYNAFIKTSYSLALFAGTLCMLISICCPLIIGICFGQVYLPMVTPLRILLLGATFSSIATVSLTYLTHNEHKQEQTWLGIGVALLHMSLALPCILLWGIVGAALASTIAHITATIGTTWLCYRLLSQH